MNAASDSPPATAKPTDWLAWGEKLLLGTLAMLLTAACLIPSDAPAGLGMFVAQSAMWMALGAGVAVWLVCRRREVKWDNVELFALGYLLWTLLSTLAVRGTGDLRSAINSFFQTAAWTVGIFATRQLLRTSQQRQTMLTLALALSAAMAVLGVLQFFIFNPETRAEIAANPRLLLDQLGIVDPESPAAHRALARAESKEPLGTFALTNSLACYLVPWMLLLVAGVWSGIARCLGKQPDSSRLVRWLCVAAGLVLLVVFAGCLLFTKSRMSIIALIVGMVLLIADRLRLGQRVAWYWWLGGAAMLGLLVLGVSLAGGLDPAVLTQASTSALYRLEYWRSTFAMIGDHWLSGCGPGNFKSTYPLYKLPQASEEIGDPHNFLLEVWATTGTPGLILLLAVVAVALWKSKVRAIESEPLAGEVFSRGEVTSWSILIVVLVGAVAAFPLAMLTGTPLLGVIGPALAICFVVLRPLVDDSLLRGAAVSLAVVAMLVNLLASGGISFPNVALPMAFLLGLASLRDSGEEPTPASSGKVDSRGPLAALGIASALFLGCYLFCYWPVVLSQSQELEFAANTDPFNPELCREQARLELERLALGKRDALNRMEDAHDEAVRRNPRSYSLQQEAGNARLYAFRIRDRRDVLLRAVDNYAAAVERYPNFSLLHAQLAWAQHVAGNDLAARKEAQEALRLDALCPHEDKKLEKQTMGDPGLSVLEQAARLDELMKRLAKPPGLR